MGKGMLGAVRGLILVAASVCASAHHSSALFDSSRSLTLHGVVKEFRWTNPHASIRVLAQADAAREEWSIEMNSPERLERAGWRPDTLRAGDRVSLVIHPMRDDTRAGQFMSGTGPRGSLIDGLPPPPVAALTLSPAATDASCPRVDVTLVQPSASSETRPVKLGLGTLFVTRNAITTTRDIAEIKVAGDDADTSIQIRYTDAAAARLHDATTDHDGLQLAFVVDDDVWLAFTWRGPYGIEPDGTQISIRNGFAKAQRLLESLRDCSDPRTR